MSMLIQKNGEPISEANVSQLLQRHGVDTNPKNKFSRMPLIVTRVNHVGVGGS